MKKDANYGPGPAGQIVEVGNYPANAFGLNDMHGNVWDRCEDWYGDYPEGEVMDPKGPDMGKFRVLRGGSCLNNVAMVRSSYRNDFSWPERNLSNFGFRLVRDP